MPDERVQHLVVSLLEGMSDACVVLDRDWRYVFVNRKAGELFGRAPASLIGKHIWTEFPDGVGQPFQLAYERAMAEQVFVRLEAYYPPFDRWFENRIHPSPECLAIFFDDVTDRRLAAEETRRDAEARVQAEQMAHLGFWEWDVPTNRVAWSDELYRIYGLAPADFEASFEGYLERVHPNDRARVRTAIKDALARCAPITFDERIVRPDGQIRHLHSWASVAADVHGAATTMFGACIDMTTLVETTEGLWRSEQWLELALEASNVGLWDWNLSSGKLVWSRGVERIFGLVPGAFDGTYATYLETVHPDDRAAVASTLSAATESGRDFSMEYRILWPDRSVRTVSSHARVFRDDTGHAMRMAGSVIDVTERRQAEDESRRADDKLRLAQKMDAIGRLAAGVAHDFNNLLTVIDSSVTLLQRAGEASRAAAVEYIGAATQRAAVLTRRMLALSRQQVLELAVHDVDELVRDMTELLSRLLPPSIELRTELGGAGRVIADRSQLEQVLLNLAVNARDAMPRGGALTISTRVADDMAAIDVRDRGVGMTAEVHARIFEPFYTTKAEGRGTGLGLAMVYGIVVQSGGRVDVTTAPDVGSTFTVLLPRTEQPVGRAPTPPAALAAHSGTERLLMVEDDDALRSLLHTILEETGYRVASAATPSHALEILGTAVPPFDLLIADVHLPEMSGVQLARRAHEAQPALKVLFMSGRRELTASDEVPLPILEKPFGPDTLVARVREVLDGSSPG